MAETCQTCYCTCCACMLKQTQLLLLQREWHCTTDAQQLSACWPFYAHAVVRQAYNGSCGSDHTVYSMHATLLQYQPVGPSVQLLPSKRTRRTWSLQKR